MTKREEGLFWEDFPEGAEDTIGPYQITRADIIAYASRYDPQPFHLDEEAAKASMIGQLCASGWHLMTFLWERADAEDEKIAFTDRLHIEECRWKLPIFPEDRLTIRRTCLERRPPAKGAASGVCLFRWDVLDQEGSQKTQIHLLRGIKLREGSAS